MFNSQRVSFLVERAYENGRMWASLYADNPHKYLSCTVWCGMKMHASEEHVCEGLTGEEFKTNYAKMLWEAFYVGMREIEVARGVKVPVRVKTGVRSGGRRSSGVMERI